MKLIPLEIGRLESDLRAMGGTEGRAVLPIPSWLIEHPDGVVLFDTGMHVSLQASSDRIGRSAAMFGIDFNPGEEVGSKVEQAGYGAGDVELIVFSHLHFDHCGGTAEIPNARIVVQRQEWEAGHDSRLIAGEVYNPADFDVGHDVQVVDGIHDVFGDGRVVCLPTPGHTKGHQSLRVQLESGPVVLTGDCIYFEWMLDNMAVPAFGFDTELQKDSMRELQRLRDEDGCRLLYGHDLDQFRALPSEGLR